MPVVDLGLAPSTGTIVLPHVAAGGKWTTDVILVNPTDTPITGTIQYLNPSGQAGAIIVPSTDGFTAPGPLSPSYVIHPRSGYKFPICGATSDLVTGSFRVVPGNNMAAPSAFVIVSLHNRAWCEDPWVWVTENFGSRLTGNEGSVVTETAIPAVASGSAFRLYAEVSELIQTGIAVANTSDSVASVTVELTRLDGSSTGLTGTLTVPAKGQLATLSKNSRRLISPAQMFRLENSYWWYVARRSLVVHLLIEELRQRKSVRILDVGCGTSANISAVLTPPPCSGCVAN